MNHESNEIGNSEEVIRVKLPRGEQKLGIVTQLLGGSKMYVKCSDGKTRLCRIPGSKRRGMWVKLNDVVLVQPWDVQSDIRGDIIYKYRGAQVNWLKKKGHLKVFEEEF